MPLTTSMRVGVASLFHDRDVAGSLAVDAHNVVLNLIGVLGLAHIVDRGPSRSGSSNRNFSQLLHGVDKAVGVDVIVVGADLDVARRQNQIGTVDGAYNVHGTQLARTQLVGINIDHDLAVFAAKRRRNLRSLHHRDLITNLELSVIVELRFVEALRP